MVLGCQCGVLVLLPGEKVSIEKHETELIAHESPQRAALVAP